MTVQKHTLVVSMQMPISVDCTYNFQAASYETSKCPLQVDMDHGIGLEMVAINQMIHNKQAKLTFFFVD